MRISKEEVEFIKYLSKKYFNSDEVYLFGSRVDNTKKGGDIDIYIETVHKSNITRKKLDFLTEYNLKFGIQKVDLVVNNFTNNKEIYKIAKKGIKL